MVNRIILNSPTEKIIKLRKKHKLTQKDLVGEDLARSTLAMIETKKVNLTENVAKIIVKNFNSLFKEMGIEEKVSYSELMESKEDQAKKVIKGFIEEFEQDLDFDKFYKILNLFFIKEDYPKLKVLSYNVLIKEVHKNENFEIAYEISEELIKACIKTREFDKALDYLDNMVFYVKKLSNYDNFNTFLNIVSPLLFKDHRDNKLYFEIGKVFYDASLFKETLLYFNYIKKASFPIEDEYEYLSKKAYCYIHMKNFEESLKILRKLSRIKDSDIKFLVQIDLANFYIKRSKNGDFDKVKRYFWKLRSIGESLDNKDLYMMKYLEIASIADFLDSKKKAYDYYRDGIINWDLTYNKSELLKAYKFVINNSTEEEMYVVNKIADILFQLIEKDADFIPIIFEILIYYKKYEATDKLNTTINYMHKKPL